MLTIFGYFFLGSGIFLAQQAFLWTHLDRLHKLGIRLPLFILVNNFITLFCLLECVEKLKHERLKLTKREKKQWIAPILAAGVVCLAFTFMEALYFWGSFFAVFYSSSGNKLYSQLLATGGILISGIVIWLTRLPVFILGGLTRPKKVWLRAVQTLALLPLMHLCELGLTIVAPTLYPIAFQIPVALKKNLVEEAHKIVGADSVNPAMYLFNPNITHRIRQQVFYISGNEGFDSAGRLLGIEIRSLLEKHSAKLVILILPEVIIDANNESQAESFAQFLTAEISANHNVIVELLFGAKLKGKNIILRATKSPAQKSFGLIREKYLLFPFFEKKTLGIDLRGSEARKNQHNGLAVFNRAELPPYARPDAFDICYESLHLERWRFGSPKLVLTNHSAFYNSLFLSKSYDLALQTLGAVFQTPLILVGNRGLTGVFVDRKDMARLNDFFDSPDGKQVRFFRVVGF
ncbi:hypothetical protein H6G17_28935 [Chroococcidiopsis sp. FACHB-1243]|uniref:hypothetical protein n=1 Tax=Chroococcidiopsis sp. [FACHB-1243] TaxID=2692781 RepID=UPI001781506E|nr:hypothetical protein [Chroococcidiopsis sp. [FACHB-1243]]MBD2309474.1 hypothetical protein [Chroococcidiopsis sp. [FACHB-1243]]